jgi:indole-3-glycerol phosphate synthase
MFVERLRGEHMAVIAECKRRSPSRGVLRADYDPVSLAREYASAGAAAVSVLTEPSFFDGSLDHLRSVRQVVALPLLRKDFILDEYQLLEARAAGADAVLLIVAALNDGELRGLIEAAEAQGFAALVEVHTAEELQRAKVAGATLLGVNSRSLRTLSVSLDSAIEMAALLGPPLTAVAESGVTSARDLLALRDAGYHACLIGEWLMRARKPGGALAELLAATREP